MAETCTIEQRLELLEDSLHHRGWKIDQLRLELLVLLVVVEDFLGRGDAGQGHTGRIVPEGRMKIAVDKRSTED
jgi:hypothetical protein